MYVDIVSDVIVDSSDTNNRPLANFHPSIWGDYFLAHASNVMIIDSTKKQEHDELKEKVRRMLIRDADDDLQTLELINAVQRLGVSYHFETEIEDALRKLHDETTNLDYTGHHDLYVVALRFRLLRQHGYYVSCETFNKFKDEEGNFIEALITDIRGMLSLYEATHHSTHADEILDEALAFTTFHLKKFSGCNEANHHEDDLFAKQVIHALNRPLHKGMPRVEARHFISVYQDEISHNETLLKFAKLDFNMIQAQYQEELRHITKWWNDLDVPNKLPYARDRLVELYFWITSVFFEPQYKTGRSLITKGMCMISLMDDTYDAYATFEENKLFTKAIDRWEVNCMNELPEYMQYLYGEIITFYDQIEQDTIKEGRPYCVNYAKDAFKELSKYYLREVKWCHEGHIPTVEEYNKVGVVTSVFPALVTIALIGMGDFATRKAFDWLSTKPKILRAASTNVRLLNDIVSYKFEKEREQHVASAVDCHMKQYGVTAEGAISFLRKKVDDTWKDINEEFLESPKDIPVSLLECMLNLTRATDVLYEGKLDGYTKSSSMKEVISSLLVEPILI